MVWFGMVGRMGTPSVLLCCRPTTVHYYPHYSCTILHYGTTTAVGALGLPVEELGLRAELAAALHQVFQLLAALQHAVYRVVQHVPGLVQAALDLHDLICIGGVLVLHDITLQLRPLHRLIAHLLGPVRLEGAEVLQQPRPQREGHAGRVLRIAGLHTLVDAKYHKKYYLLILDNFICLFIYFSFSILIFIILLLLLHRLLLSN